MNIAEVLEAKRAERGITIAELSRRTEIPYDTVIRSMKGQTMPKGDQLLKLCRELGLKFSDFGD